jgi:23S rRNA pseudouridine2605 synthase
MAMNRTPKTPRSGGERPAVRRPGRGDRAANSNLAKSKTAKPRVIKPRAAKPGVAKPRVTNPSEAASGAWPEHPASERRGRSALSGAGEGDGDRIAKVMARAGLCSRRDAEDWIAAGRVAVNGGTISSPAVNVSARDRVTVDGKPMPRPERTRLFLYNKPAGLVTTNADPEGRPTVFDALPKGLPRLMSVGRLDIGTEGLLLLTNDGSLARELELPETAWVRRYRVRAHGQVTQDELDTLRDGVTVEGIHYGPVEAVLEREQGANVWISFTIREGKNREVRNVLSHVGLAVNRLIRVEFGPFGLGELPEGEVEEVETGNLRSQLGPRIVSRAGCDFSGPAARPAAESREERREHRHALRESLRDSQRRPRDTDPGTTGVSPAVSQESGRDARGPRESDGQPEKPLGRPRRGHAWRQDDAPLGRTYRGSRRDDLRIDGEDRPDKRTDHTTDRKGRRVVVERFGTPKEKPEAAETETRGRPPRRGPPRDRASGPRPSRPRLAEERADGRAGPERPRKFGDRAEGRGDRDGKRGEHSSRPPRPRAPGERADGRAGSDRPRKFGERTEGRGDRDGKRGEHGSRPSRPRTPGERAGRTGSDRPRKFGERTEGRGDRDGKRGEHGSRPPRPHGQRPSSSGPKRPPGPRSPGPRPSGSRPPRKH